MSREWKPGDVAMVTFDNASIAMRSRGETDITTSIGLRREDDWALPSYGTSIESDDARPLVVIDPEDESDVRRLCEAYRSVDHGVGTLPMQRALRSLASPKPAEPTGLGARVETANGIRYTRFSDSESHNEGDWINEDGVIVQWSEIDAVRVLSEGVTA